MGAAAAAVDDGTGFFGIGGTSALELRPECQPVSAPFRGLVTPFVPLKIFPFLVRTSRLPMRSSEDKTEEEEVEEVKEVEQTAANAGDDNVLIEETNEVRS